MSLQFIMGGAGSGKSTTLYNMISREAAEHREKNFIVLVPDQFTLETQRTLVERSGRGGILNVDVLSFHRLAYRVFEEVPALRKTVLEDMGKMMLLRKVFAEQKKNLKYFKRGIQKPGFLDECKSFLCELMQYAVGEEEFDRMEECLGGESLMACKIRDLRLIYHALKEKMGDTYMMAEELVPQLTGVAASIDMLRDSVICLDGFTGFTPTQYDLLRELLTCCEKMFVTVTTDRTGKRRDVFSLSTDTVTRLSKIAAEVHVGIEEPILTGRGGEKIPYRVAESRDLRFLEEHIFSYGRTEQTGEVRDIQVRACRREADEAAYAARTIWWLVQEEGYSYGDIAIVTGDIASYEQPLAREMGRLGIRYFMDYKKSIGANALAEYSMSFLEMVRRNMDYESTFRFLRCGLSPLSAEETDILENYVIARGRRGFRSYRQEWEYTVERLDLVEVNEYRAKFMDSVGTAVARCQGGKKTVREFTEILYRLITDNHLYERVTEQSRRFEEEGNPLLASEYSSIYRLMMELFDELVELLGGETVSFREYEEILSAGISEGLVGFVPPSSNQVMVGDVERSRLNNIKVLFFMGVNDDRIPRVQGGPGILSESERRKIAEAGVELAPLPEEQACTGQFYLYLTLTKPSDKLFLTYSRMGGDGAGRRPAYLIHSIQTLFPDLVPVDDEREHSLRRALGTDRGRQYLITRLADGSFRKDACWWELAAYYREREPALFEKLLSMRAPEKKTRLSREAAELLYGSRLYGNVTRLEQFARCPYAHFVIFGLGLKEREEYTVGAIDYGNVFHGAMEHFSHELEERGIGWKELGEEEVAALAGESVEYATSGYKGKMFHQSKRVEFMIVRMKQIMRDTVWGIWRQMREGEFVQMYSEKRFSGQDDLSALSVPLGDGRTLVLGGQIDRVDVCGEADRRLIKIIDYKSGQRDLSLSKVYYGLQLQLVTYMAAAMEMEEKKYPESRTVPAAMLYYQMKEPELVWQEESAEGRKERLLEAMKCAGYVNEEPEILEKMDRQVAENGQIRPDSRSRFLPVAVKKDGTFRKGSHVMSTEEFKRLMEHSRAKMEEFGRRIFDGEADAAPYRSKSECGCDYCGLKGVCGVEKRELSARVREYPELEDEEVWEVLYGRDSVER